MSDLLAFLIRMGQSAFWSALALILFVSFIGYAWPVLILLLIVGVYTSLNAYANRVEEASAKRQAVKRKWFG